MQITGLDPATERTEMMDKRPRQKKRIISANELADALIMAERHKSNLILEANLLQYQGQYEAAEIEEDLASQ